MDFSPDVVVKWLESEQGEAWSRRKHRATSNSCFLASIKDQDANMPVVILWFAMSDSDRLDNSI